MKQLLIIDDDDLIIDSLKLILQSFSINVTGFLDPIEGQKNCLKNDYDLILLDLNMPEIDGAELAISLLQSNPKYKIFIITGTPMDFRLEKALNAGVLGVVKKPFEIDKIVNFLEKK